jgi:hypothetical protein
LSQQPIHAVLFLSKIFLLENDQYTHRTYALPSLFERIADCHKQINSACTKRQPALATGFSYDKLTVWEFRLVGLGVRHKNPGHKVGPHGQFLRDPYRVSPFKKFSSFREKI